MAPLPSPSTIGDAIQALTQMFEAAGLDQTRLDARLIVTHVAGCSPETALIDPDRGLNSNHVTEIEQLAERRLKREPVAYLTGSRAFWSLSLGVDANTLCPRPDTETLVESVIAEVGSERKNEALRILDLGTGSGCILASLLSEFPNATGLGIDISEPTAQMARRNAAYLGLSDRMQVTVGNWLEGVSGTFDLVVSNPPYIPGGEIDDLEPEVSVYEPRIALDGGTDGLDAYRCISADLCRVLAPGGIAAFEIGMGQVDDVGDILGDSGFENARVYSDLPGIERVVMVTRDK
jgi:release factor glutamine methyltransferase